MSPEDWKAAWGIEHLIFVNDQAGQLPESARQFLQLFGLPRYFTFKSAGAGIRYEISFEQLAREIVSYDKLVTRDLFNEQELLDWSQQLVIGHHDAGQPYGEFCVHQTTGTVTYIFGVDDSVPDEFVNSSVPKFGKSLSLLRQWSLASRTSTVATWQTDVSKLAEELRNVDPDAFQHEKYYWPSEVRFLHKCVTPGSVEITFDPIPEFRSWENQPWQRLQSPGSHA